jgi:peptidoglycan/xylan/chitin deacetylase (PgdA/CDA1 family)
MMKLDRARWVAGLARLAHLFSVHRLIEGARPNLGLILMLHSVRPSRSLAEAPFQPNRDLSVTPEFLARLIAHFRDRGFDFVTLDEAIERITAPRRATRRIAVVTLDDGYRDNLTYALPVFRRTVTPFTLYVATAGLNGSLLLPWRVIEDVVARNDVISDGEGGTWRADTHAAKLRAFTALDRHMMGLPATARTPYLMRLASRYGISPSEQCRSEIMTWEELGELARDPLATIGSHTVSHPILSDIADDALRFELTESKREIEARLGRRCAHLAYPYGSAAAVGRREIAAAAAAGYTSAVTTRLASLRESDRALLHQLPRINVRGLVPDLAVLDVMASGAPMLVRQTLRALTGSPVRAGW